MIINKPTILIYAFKPDEDILKEICAGIEEEGVLYEIVIKDPLDIQEKVTLTQARIVDDLSFESAGKSILGSGIGMYQTETALYLSSLPKGKPVFYMKSPSLEQARKLGANAARAVKRMPFKELE